MILNVFDITTKFELRRYNVDLSMSEESIKKRDESFSLSRSLIYPNENTNRTPYIQNCKSPEVSDIVYDGHPDYKNTFLVSEIFNNLDENKNDAANKLRAYFSYQYADIVSQFNLENSFNIILIPDVFSPITQEYILSSGVFNRENTRLLWRSVASVIGIDFEKKGAQEGDNILVIDTYFGKCYGTVLTLKKHDRGGQLKLVPQRKAYIEKNKETNYPEFFYFRKQMSIPADVYDFFLRTFWGTQEQKFYAPKNGIWGEYDSPRIENQVNITHENLKNIKYCVISGETLADMPISFPRECIVVNYDCTYTFGGAVKFYYRTKKGLPTYLDQCEALRLVVQHRDKETIVAKTLIEEDDQCVGGEIKKGYVNREYYLEPQNRFAKFFLILGDEGSQLKILTQDIGKESINKQNLTLTSSMIPGQGIAIVQVDAKPLIENSIKLDFLKMENSEKTLMSLQNELKRSFPIDMPLVKADSSLWDRTKHEVLDYLDNGFINKMKSMFSKSQCPNKNATGIERFQRINVFGNDTVKNRPNVDGKIMSRLYYKLYYDYFEPELQPYIVNIFAWMYIDDKDKYFKHIVYDVIGKVEQAANSGAPIKKQYLTFCANNLTSKELLVRYFNACCLRLEKSLITSSSSKNKSTEWVRGLAEMLMFNNEMLSIFSDDKSLEVKPKYACKDCMGYLIKTFDIWVKENRSVRSFRYVLKAMLFLLKYRKYDKTFIRENDLVTSGLFHEILISTSSKNLRKLQCFDEIKDLIDCFRDFINGNGSLDGIPVD